jgi:cardiolipin synthase
MAALLNGCASERPILYNITPQFTVHDPQFAQTMGHLLGPQLVGENTVTTLTNGDQIFPAMLDAIHSAQKTITFETYIYWSGKMGQAFADALAERARAGVKVYALIDWVGGDRIDPKYVKEMTDAGCQVKRYHPFHILLPATWFDLDHRTHRKILVIDGTIGFTGGVGIADDWMGNAQDSKHWRDTHYRIEGPVVSQLQAVFDDNWMQTTGEVLQGNDFFPELHAKGKQWAQVFKSSFTGGSENMQLLFLLSIAAAGSDIRIENAYFVPDELTIRSLTAAAKRGVHVTIIVPGAHIDEKEVRQASRAHWGKLLKAGIEIWEYHPTMFHCKLLIVDDLWVSIGSSNMDNRSFRVNDEANINVLDADFAAEQIREFEADKKRSRQVTYDQWARRPLGEKIGDHFFTAFGWEL